jgi:hypothetical protein
MNQACWLDIGDGQAPIACRLNSISEHRAKLELVLSSQISDEFVLYLTKDGKVARKCRIVERTESEIEVEFLARAISPISTVEI